MSPVSTRTNPPTEPEFLLAAEAADLMRTPRATLYQWRHAGQGPPARKVGRKLLYRREEVLAWVESHMSNEVHTPERCDPSSSAAIPGNPGSVIAVGAIVKFGKEHHIVLSTRLNGDRTELFLWGNDNLISGICADQVVPDLLAQRALEEDKADFEAGL